MDPLGIPTLPLFVNALKKIRDFIKDENILVLNKADAEKIWICKQETIGQMKNPYYEPRKMEILDQAFKAIKELPFIEFTTIGEYLEKFEPEKTVFLRTMAGNWDMSGWLRGSERLHLLFHEAREEIRNAECMIILSDKLGMNTEEAKRKLEEARKSFLEAQNSSGYATSAFKSYPYSYGILANHELALKAKNLAREAVEKIAPATRKA